ncbi:hypothetical protein SI65_09124 [Aspergillus cristatus]|uniref:DDE-1 domain-containing protein n=1 Tax=Aspergillus cristatus TaxID=573508 RepID=A0A1E3B3X3_ASPCR|nr:hypothetical protein SI65_09124 [Aspergillus cristatus]
MTTSVKLNDQISIPIVGTPLPHISKPPTNTTQHNQLAYGTGTAWYKSSGDNSINRDLVEAIKTAIRLGYRHLDGAEVYGTEAELGVAIKESGRGLPLQLSTVRHLAQLLLSARLPGSQPAIGENWVKRFIDRHEELKSKYTRKYDYQRAKSENPHLIQSWFMRVRETIEKYGIVEGDIYNMDETGFQMGITSTAKVVCGMETRQSHAKALQPGNRKWVTAIVCMNAVGWALPPQIIFAAANHQSLWYHDIPDDYTISVSKNGWTTDELGLGWL